MLNNHEKYDRPYSIEQLYYDYIEENFSANEIANKYNLPKYVIETDLKKYNIKKPKDLVYSARLKKVDKEKLYYFYIVCNYSMEKTAKLLNIGTDLVSKLCHQYNFQKSKEELNLNLKKQIDKEVLYKYYIEENHTNQETADFFNINERTLRRKCREYGISKSTELQVEANKKKQIEKYGSLFVQSQYYKDNIVNSMVEKVKNTCYNKYGVSTWLQTEEGQRCRSAKYKYDNILFDSSWELALWIYAKDHDEEIIREPQKFSYYIEGQVHYYIPDFLYNGRLIDIKGDHLIKNGKLSTVYKTSQQKDFYKQQCIDKNNVYLLQYKDIKFAIDYVKQKYGKEHIASFKINK